MLIIAVNIAVALLRDKNCNKIQISIGKGKGELYYEEMVIPCITNGNASMFVGRLWSGT